MKLSFGIAALWALFAISGNAFVLQSRLNARRLQPVQGKIHDAAEAGDLAYVAECIVKEAKMVYSKDIEGNTPLHKAALFGHLELVKFLIGQGADPNFKNDRGRTPLQWACQWGWYGPEFKEIAKYLAANGGDVNLKNKDGKSAVDFANGCDPKAKGHPKWGDELTASWSGTTISVHPDKSDYFRSTLPTEKLVPVYEKKTEAELLEAARKADYAEEQKAEFQRKMVEKMAKGGRSFESGVKD